MSTIHDIRTARAPIAAFVGLGLFWGTFAALVPELKTRTGLSDGAFGTAMFVAALGAILAMWLAPLADERLGRRAMAVLAVAFALCAPLPGAAGAGVGFALAMLVLSMFSGTLDVVMNARIAAFEAETRRPLMNLAHGLFSMGYAGAALAAGLMRAAGWPAVLVLGITGLCILLLAVVAAQDGEAGSEAQAQGARTAMPWHILVPGGMIILVAFMTEQATEGWSALHLERGLGAGAAFGALGPATLGLTMGLGRLSGQAIAARFAERSVISAGAVLAAAGAVTAAHAPALWLAYVGFAAVGLGVSVIAPMVFAWVGRSLPHGQRTAAISRLSVIGYAGFFLGPPMMGFLSEGFGLAASFSAIAILLAAVPLALVPALSRRARRA